MACFILSTSFFSSFWPGWETMKKWLYFQSPAHPFLLYSSLWTFPFLESDRGIANWGQTSVRFQCHLHKINPSALRSINLFRITVPPAPFCIHKHIVCNLRPIPWGVKPIELGDLTFSVVFALLDLFRWYLRSPQNMLNCYLSYKIPRGWNSRGWNSLLLEVGTGLWGFLFGRRHQYQWIGDKTKNSLRV